MGVFSSTRNTLRAFRSGTDQPADCRPLVGEADLRDQDWDGFLVLQSTVANFQASDGRTPASPFAIVSSVWHTQMLRDAAQAAVNSGADQEYPALCHSFGGV